MKPVTCETEKIAWSENQGEKRLFQLYPRGEGIRCLFTSKPRIIGNTESVSIRILRSYALWCRKNSRWIEFLFHS
jgi:hypothetical protein